MLSPQTNKEENSKNPDETLNTVKSKNKTSLNKSGIEYMAEAKDYNNLIGNLKTLLNKGKP